MGKLVGHDLHVSQQESKRPGRERSVCVMLAPGPDRQMEFPRALAGTPGSVFEPGALRSVQGKHLVGGGRAPCPGFQAWSRAGSDSTPLGRASEPLCAPQLSSSEPSL